MRRYFAFLEDNSLLCAYNWGGGERRASITPSFLGELYNEISQAVWLVRNVKKKPPLEKCPLLSTAE